MGSCLKMMLLFSLLAACALADDAIQAKLNACICALLASSGRMDAAHQHSVRPQPPQHC